MPLMVYYNQRIGSYTRTIHDQQLDVEIFKANCLCASVYREFTDEEKTTFNAYLQYLFADIKHLKRCLNMNLLDDCDNFRFYGKELDKEHWKMVQELAKNGKHVKIN